MESNYLVPMGKRIGDIRRAHNLTQEKLADMLDVNPKHISHTERGASSFSLKNLVEFCTIFECSLDYVVLGKTMDDNLNKLPAEVIEILNNGDDTQISRVNKVLELFIEITKKRE